MARPLDGARVIALLLVVAALSAIAVALNLVPAIVAVGPVLRPALLVCATLGVVGAALLWRRRPSIGAGELALIALSMCVALGALEVAIRLRERMANLNGERFDRDDPRLGWTLKAGVKEMHAGHRYTTTSDGLRARLNAGAPRTVVVIGDSYTQAVQVDDDSTYWARLARARPDLHFVVMGVGGFSTAQEAMELERLVKREHPVAVLWQLCGNDLIDNDYELERQSLWNNNGRRRPYWEGDRVMYRNPRSTRFGLHSSALYRIVAGHLAVLRAERLKERSVEMELDRHPVELQRARTATRTLFDRAVQHLGTASLLAFLSDDDATSRELAGVAREAGITLTDVAVSLERARGAGAEIATSPTDAHWNDRGHAIAAGLLDNALARIVPRAGATSVSAP